MASKKVLIFVMWIFLELDSMVYTGKYPSYPSTLCRKTGKYFEISALSSMSQETRALDMLFRLGTCRYKK